MNRTTFVAAAAVALSAVTVVPASAGSSAPVIPSEVTDLIFPDADRPDRPQHPERLHMRCAGRAEGDQAAIGCGWTEPSNHRVAGYRLWRGTSAEDATVIWRGEGQRHIDTTVEPGDRYGYLVEALAHDGSVVGRSDVVWATAGEEDPSKDPSTDPSHA